jgi:acetyltransferase-like isoleucine patch superfamily enzyme
MRTPNHPDIYIHPTANVHADAVIGKGTRIWDWTKVREGARIGSGCSFGQGCYVDVEVIVGNDCKVQNGVSLYRGVIIGDRVFVGPNVTFTNHRIPRAFAGHWELSYTHIEDGASIGANATLVCGIRLGAYCIIAAGSVVTQNVPAYGLVMGNPARLVDYVTRSGRRLHWPLDGELPKIEILEAED